MCSLSLFKPTTIAPHSTSPSLISLPYLSHHSKPPFFPHPKSKRRSLTLTLCKSLDSDDEAEVEEDEWVKRLPEKKKPLYAHSLPCIEAWLRQLGFRQSGEDPAAWAVENGNWRANLNLDVTDLYIRYLKTGPGNLEKDVERRFSYALSREDIENAILGGP